MEGCPAAGIYQDGRKYDAVQCIKSEPGTGSMNQGQLEIVQQEVEQLNVAVLGVR